MSEFERLLGDPNEQFDKRSEILASIEAYSKAPSSTASGWPDGHSCSAPEALSHDAETWTCTGCGKKYERHWDAWWQPVECP